jgi:[acyl-carrier-protein] S-malonyltransferase
MTSSLTILCPGQGAQAIGMGKVWFDASAEARATFASADALLAAHPAWAPHASGVALSTLCFSGPAERLNQTDASQPAIFTASIACYRGLLAQSGSTPADQPLTAAAGLSLGEYTALCVAGAISFEDALSLVTLRGRAMQDAADSPQARAGGGGTMLALIGATEEQATEICEKARGSEVLVCANFNAPGQIVLSGHKAACDRAAPIASGMGLRATPLTVAGAFHSPLMAPAANRLAQALAGVTIKEPRCRVMSNVTGLPHAADPGRSLPDTIRVRLVEQLTHPVRWAQNAAWLASNTKDEFVELAPGKTLAGLMRRISKETKVVSHDVPATPATA